MPSTSMAAAINPRRACLAIAVLYSIAVGAHAVSHSHFRIDDFEDFSRSVEMSLFDFAKKPDDIQFIPLHRIATALFHEHFPTQFPIAVALLVSLQIAALLIIDRLLERLRPSPWNGLLLATFAANVYLIVPISYWTSGLHRIPFTALSALCVYAYTRFRDEGKLRDQALTVLSCFLAMGFYTKAALLLPMLAAYEICLSRRPTQASIAQRAATFVGLAAVLSLYPVSYLINAPTIEPLAPNFDALPAMIAHSFSVFAHAPFAVVATLQSSYPIAVALAWGLLAIFTVYRNRFNALIWLMGVATIGAHVAMIGMSQRARDLGAMTAYIYRYQFELALPLVVFASLLWTHLTPLRSDPKLPKQRKGRTRRKTRNLPQWLTSPWCVPPIVAIYATFSWLQASELMRDHYRVNERARSYTTNILEQLPDVQPLVLIEGRVPRFMWVYDQSLRFHSNFLPLLGIDATYDVPSNEMYTINSEGDVRRVETLERQSFEFADLGSTPLRLTGIKVDEAGCITVKSEPGGILELDLDTQTPLYRGFVSAKYTAASAITLRLATWDGFRMRPAVGAGREFVLPAGTGERLVDISSSGLEPTRVRALELTIPTQGLCLHQVRLVGYQLEAGPPTSN